MGRDSFPDRARRLPLGALVLYDYWAASPTDPTRRARLLLRRDGTLLRDGIAEPAPATWQSQVRAALPAFLDEPADRQLLAPPGAGVGPTCGGSYHQILGRRSLLGAHAVFYSHFDWTGTTVPSLLALLEAARTRSPSFISA